MTNELDASGDLDAELVPRAPSCGHMLDDVARILRLTPEQRLRELGNIARFVQAARRV